MSLFYRLIFQARLLDCYCLHLSRSTSRAAAEDSRTQGTLSCGRAKCSGL